MSKAFSAFHLIKYLLTARSRFRIHSPFVHHFCEDVLFDKRQYYAFQSIEKIREELLADPGSIEVTDLGAGSKINTGSKRRIAEIVRNVSVPAKYGRLLFKIAMSFGCEHILELGTSVGFGTAYLAAQNSRTTVQTIEGCPETAALARRNFSTLKLPNITIQVGNFDEKLAPIIQSGTKFDLIYIDGNHNEKSTLDYFDSLFPCLSEKGIMVLDDIYWSVGMKNAWNSISNDKKISLSIDLFRMGLVFKNPDIREKQTLRIRY